MIGALALATVLGGGFALAAIDDATEDNTGDTKAAPAPPPNISPLLDCTHAAQPLDPKARAEFELMRAKLDFERLELLKKRQRQITHHLRQMHLKYQKILRHLKIVLDS